MIANATIRRVWGLAAVLLAAACAGGADAHGTPGGVASLGDDEGTSFVDPADTDTAAGSDDAWSGSWGSGPWPSAELCNGVDDDDDALVDEDLEPLECGVGACAVVAEACIDGVPGFCTPGTPADEICDNGIDDDCDGETDERDACGRAGPVGFGDCMNQATEAVCLADQEWCRYTPDEPRHAHCSQECVLDEDCPLAPPGGDAMVRCRDDDAVGVKACALVCEGGRTCPDGMACVGGTTCAWLLDPSVVGFGPCQDGCGDIGSEVWCVVNGSNPTAGVCAKQGCDSAADCFAPPGGAAPVACGALSQDGSALCTLDCSGGDTCPPGMLCHAGMNADLCMWPF